MTTRSLDDLLGRYPESVQGLAKSVRAFVLETLPDAAETIDDTAPVIGFGYGPGYKGMICSLILSKSGVKLGLAQGAALPDPEHLLEGDGKVHRYAAIRGVGDLRKAGIKQLLIAASAASRARLG